MKSKEEILRALARSDDDRMLLANALDKLATCHERAYLTSTRFLDLRERSLVAQAVRLAGGEGQMVFAGGYTDAERACAVFYPDYLTAEDAQNEDNTPIALLRVHKHAADTLTHRDYLGSLMGLGLRRDSVGDILVSEQGADILVLREVAEFVRLHFAQAGRKRLSLEALPLSDLHSVQEEGEAREGSVASARLDSIVALTFGLSRTEAQSEIACGRVFVNQLGCEKAEKEIEAGDRITVRGKGRVRVLEFTGVSRKGRQFVRFVRSG
ncbi:MAG: RNA-binding protein [Clostridia bacterium]|nr:RNA-binding protein [Clostridia bacterium]